MQEAQNPDFLDFGNFSSNTFGSSLEIFAQHTPIQRHTPTIQQLTHPLGVPLPASSTFVAMVCAVRWGLKQEHDFFKNTSYGDIRRRPLGTSERLSFRNGKAPPKFVSFRVTYMHWRLLANSGRKHITLCSI